MTCLWMKHVLWLNIHLMFYKQHFNVHENIKVRTFHKIPWFPETQTNVFFIAFIRTSLMWETWIDWCPALISVDNEVFVSLALLLKHQKQTHPVCLLPWTKETGLKEEDCIANVVSLWSRWFLPHKKWYHSNSLCYMTFMMTYDEDGRLLPCSLFQEQISDPWLLNKD